MKITENESENILKTKYRKILKQEYYVLLYILVPISPISFGFFTCSHAIRTVCCETAQLHLLCKVMWQVNTITQEFVYSSTQKYLKIPPFSPSAVS